MSQLLNAPNELGKTISFSKAAVFYLLIVSIVDSPSRLNSYLKSIASILCVLGSMMILGRYGWFSTEYAETALRNGSRIGAIGSKNFDANDTAALLVPGILLSAHFSTTSRRFAWRIIWAILAILTAYAFLLTDSRGGLLGLATGAICYIWLRWGLRGVAWGMCLLPLLAVRIVSARMADMNAVYEGTGQLRVQMWHTAFVLFKQNPLLGIGPDRFTDVVGRACHNSFMQAFTDLGFLGGAFFVGAFYVGATAIYRATTNAERESLEGNAKDSTPAAVFAVLIGFGTAIFSLNHVYTSCTYLVLGVAACCTTFYMDSDCAEIVRPHLLRQIIYAGVGFLAFIYVAANLLVTW